MAPHRAFCCSRRHSPSFATSFSSPLAPLTWVQLQLRKAPGARQHRAAAWALTALVPSVELSWSPLPAQPLPQSAPTARDHSPQQPRAPGIPTPPALTSHIRLVLSSAKLSQLLPARSLWQHGQSQHGPSKAHPITARTVQRLLLTKAEATSLLQEHSALNTA